MLQIELSQELAAAERPLQWDVPKSLHGIFPIVSQELPASEHVANAKFPKGLLEMKTPKLDFPNSLQQKPL